MASSILTLNDLQLIIQPNYDTTTMPLGQGGETGSQRPTDARERSTRRSCNRRPPDILKNSKLNE